MIWLGGPKAKGFSDLARLAWAFEACRSAASVERLTCVRLTGMIPAVGRARLAPAPSSSLVDAAAARDGDGADERGVKRKFDSTVGSAV